MDPRQRAKDLVELAVDGSTTHEERASAAVKAVAFIHKHNLLSSPLDMLDGNPTIRAARTLFEKFMDPEVKSSINTIKNEVASARKRGGSGRSYTKRR